MQPFPVELWHEVFKLVCNSTLSNLRLACKSFNEVASRIMFGHASIRYPLSAYICDPSNLDKYLALLRALATGEHPWATYALSLDIGDLGPEDYNFPEEAEDYSARYNTEVLEPYDSQRELIQDLLEGAVANCQRVITVVWKISKNTCEWSRDGVLSGLEEMKALKALTLELKLHYVLLSLEYLPPLEVLKIRSSSSNYALLPGTVSRIYGLSELITKSSSTLRHLNLLLYCSEDEASFLSSLVQSAQPLRITHLDVGGSAHLLKSFVPHIGSLRSLSLGRVFRRDTGISTAGDTWSMLTDEEIYLQRIAHIEITQSMLKYFGSYSGLKSVKFEMKHYGNVDKELKEITFNEYLDALGNHAGSLEDLTILPPGEEGDWCVSERNIMALSKFVNLRYLFVTILADSERKVPRRQGTINYNLNADYYSPSHSVCLLLQMASSFPNLIRLSIGCARLRQLHPIVRKADRMEHAIHPAVQIDTHVRMFGPLDPLKYRFEVRNRDRWYILKRMGEGDGYWYCVA